VVISDHPRNSPDKVCFMEGILAHCGDELHYTRGSDVTKNIKHFSPLNFALYKSTTISRKVVTFYTYTWQPVRILDSPSCAASTRRGGR
jgi:hypothetical protein